MQLEAKCQSLVQQLELHKATEKELRKQLDSSLGRFSEFQEALTQSNEVSSLVLARRGPSEQDVGLGALPIGEVASA